MQQRRRGRTAAAVAAARQRRLSTLCHSTAAHLNATLLICRCRCPPLLLCSCPIVTSLPFPALPYHLIFLNPIGVFYSTKLYRTGYNFYGAFLLVKAGPKKTGHTF